MVWFIAALDSEGLLDHLGYEPAVLDNVLGAGDPALKVLLVVEYAVVAPVHGGAEVDCPGERAVLEALHTLLQALAEIPDGAGVADGCEDSPTAPAAVDAAQATGFGRRPGVVACSERASNWRAPDASTNFVKHRHFI